MDIVPTIHAHILPKKTYLVVAAILGVLLVLTLAAAELNLGRWNMPLAVTIAMAKATLIVLYFMHVRYGSPLLRVFAAGGFVWLLLMFVLSFSDYSTRDTTTTTPIEAAQAGQLESINPQRPGRD